MSDHCQNSVIASPSGAAFGTGWRRSMPGFSAEPSFAEMVEDPLFQQMMASDRVSMESFKVLVSTVRQRLVS